MHNKLIKLRMQYHSKKAKTTLFKQYRKSDKKEKKRRIIRSKF